MDDAHRHVEFASTRWSLVLDVGKRQAKEADAALAELCQRYWLPLYAYVRRRVTDVHSAQDLTQEFFARLLEKDVLAEASPERGRFRSFLLVSMKNFLANERDRAHALKRGGGKSPISWEWEAGESRLHLEPVDNQTPEREFERRWVLTLLELVMDRLQAEYVEAGKGKAFELLKPTLTNPRGETFAAIATELDCSDDNARQLAHRLKKRYRELLRQEVAQTVAEPSEVDDEIRSLFAALET